MTKTSGKKLKAGNWQKAVWEKADICKCCELTKSPPGCDLKHHGALCHFCHIKLQFYKRKYDLPSSSMQCFNELQLGYVKAESIRWRNKCLEELGNKGSPALEKASTDHE